MATHKQNTLPTRAKNILKRIPLFGTLSRKKNSPPKRFYFPDWDLKDEMVPHATTCPGFPEPKEDVSSLSGLEGLTRNSDFPPDESAKPVPVPRKKTPVRDPPDAEDLSPRTNDGAATPAGAPNPAHEEGDVELCQSLSTAEEGHDAAPASGMEGDPRLQQEPNSLEEQTCTPPQLGGGPPAGSAARPGSASSSSLYSDAGLHDFTLWWAVVPLAEVNVP